VLVRDGANYWTLIAGPAQEYIAPSKSDHGATQHSRSIGGCVMSTSMVSRHIAVQRTAAPFDSNVRDRWLVIELLEQLIPQKRKSNETRNTEPNCKPK
jgi:hypothetical protein